MARFDDRLAPLVIGMAVVLDRSIPQGILIGAVKG